jgi:hypothetical protein
VSKDRKKGKKKPQRQKDLERRLRPGGQVPDLMMAAQVLSQPDKFAEALRLFSERALLTPGLAGFRLPRQPLLEAFLVTPPPEAGDDAERRRAVRAAILPRLATPDQLQALQAAIQRAKKDVQHEAELMSLFAAQALATACEEEGGRPGHVFWELAFDITVTDLTLSGELLVGVVLGALKPPAEEVAATFARVLTQVDVSRELDALGVHERDPRALAERYVAQVHDQEPYHLQFDAVLHLLWHQQELVTGAPDVLRVGLSEARRADIVERAEAAYLEDITDVVREDLLRWTRARLEQLRDEPPAIARSAVEHERLRAGVTHLGLRAFPREHDALLRAIHAQSLLHARRRAPAIEVPFVHEVSARPDDLFAIDEYERFLTERGEIPRARRVRRYRDFVKHAREQQPAPAAGGGQEGAA